MDGARKAGSEKRGEGQRRARKEGIGLAVWAKRERNERKDGREDLGRKTGWRRRKKKKKREGRSWAGLKEDKEKERFCIFEKKTKTNPIQIQGIQI